MATIVSCFSSLCCLDSNKMKDDLLEIFSCWRVSLFLKISRLFFLTNFRWVYSRCAHLLLVTWIDHSDSRESQIHSIGGRTFLAPLVHLFEIAEDRFTEKLSGLHEAVGSFFRVTDCLILISQETSLMHFFTFSFNGSLFRASTFDLVRLAKESELMQSYPGWSW